MVTTRCLNQQGSRLRQKPSQVQPTENIGNISASRRFLWVRSTVSTVSVWSAASTSESEKKTSYREDCPMCCPFKKVIKSDTQSFLALLEDKLCDILQAMAPTNVETVHQTSMLHIESNPDRLGLLSPTHGKRSHQQSGQITLRSVLINKPEILKATYHTEIRKIENTEVYGGGGLELVKPAREPASSRPKSCASLKNPH